MRRLGNKLKNSIGRTGGINANIRFDPNAFDGDNDGLVQDATPFERPALPTAKPPTGSDPRSMPRPQMPLATAPRKKRPILSLRNNRNNPILSLRRKGKRPAGYPDHLSHSSLSDIVDYAVAKSRDELFTSFSDFRAGTPEQWDTPNDTKGWMYHLIEAELAKKMAEMALQNLSIAKTPDDTPLDPDFSPEAQAIAREFVENGLKNPLMLEIVKKFGIPKVVVNKNKDPRYAAYYVNHLNTIFIDADAFQTLKSLSGREQNEFDILQTRDGRKILTRAIINPTNEGTFAHEYGHYIKELLRLEDKYHARVPSTSDDRKSTSNRNRFLYPKGDEDSHPLSLPEIRQFWGRSLDTSMGAGRRNEAKKKDRIYADSIYAEENDDELFAEAFSALMRPDNEGLVNDFTVQYFADLLGLPTRPSKGHNSIKLQLPSQQLMPDGRPLLPLLPRNRPNVGVKSNNRLHDRNNPIFVSHGRARQGLFSIGNHRFYDQDQQSLYLVGDNQTLRNAVVAGARFLGDDTHANVVRNISRVQLGFPLNDMPLTGNENDEDMEIYGALITGDIAQLPYNERRSIEKAVKDANDIFVGIQDSPKTNKPLYRVLDTDLNAFFNSFSEGDEFPLPITGFTEESDDEAPIVLKINKGARALQLGEDYLTQGTFRVSRLTRDKDRVIAELDHVETFDPRHDAMRTVVGDDTPQTMRSRGLASRRYTDEEAKAIIADKNERADLTTSEYDIDLDTNKTLDTLIQEEMPDDNLLTRIKNTVERFVQQKIDARLAKHQAFMTERYSIEKPYVQDAEVLKRWATPEVGRLILSVNKKIDFANKAAGNKYSIVSSLDADGIRKLIDTSRYTFTRADPEWDGTDRSLQLDLTPEEKDALQTMADALEATERAYLNKVKLPIENGHIVVQGQAIMRIGRYSSGDMIEFNAQIFDYAAPFNKGVEPIRVGRMNRIIMKPSSPDALFPSSRETAEVHHASLFISEQEYKGLGIAGLLNTHSYAWWQRAGFGRVHLEPAADGPFVWQLLGFVHSEDETVPLRVYAKDAIGPLKRELKNYLKGKPDTIIANDATAARVAWWIRATERNPELASFVTLANLFDLTPKNKPLLSDFFKYEIGAGGGFGTTLEMSLADKPTIYMPYHVLPRDPLKFVQQSANLGVRSSSGNLMVSKYHLINNDDDSAPITQEQASFWAQTIKDAEAFRQSNPGQINSVSQQDYVINSLFESAGYNLPPILITRANAASLINKKDSAFGGMGRQGNNRFYPYTVIARGNGIRAASLGMDADVATRQYMTGPRFIETMNSGFLHGGGDYFSAHPLTWAHHFATLDKDGNFISALDDNNKSATLALIPPSSRVGSYEEYTRTQNELFQLLDLDGVATTQHQWQEDTFQGDNLPEGVLYLYNPATSVEAQRARRAKIMSISDENLSPSTKSILNLIYELEDAKTEDNKEDITRVQRLFAYPSEAVYGVLHGYDVMTRRPTGSHNDDSRTYEGSVMTVLNRSALMVVDEPMSLLESHSFVTNIRRGMTTPLGKDTTFQDGESTPDWLQFFGKGKNQYAVAKREEARRNLDTQAALAVRDYVRQGQLRQSALRRQEDSTAGAKPYGLRSRTDKNLYNTLYKRLRDAVEGNFRPLTALFFIASPENIETYARKLAEEYNLYTEQINALRLKLDNAEINALTDTEIYDLERQLENLTGRLETTINSWGSYVGTANQLSRERIAVQGRKKAILAILRKIESHLGDDYENNKLVIKLRKELEQIATREKLLSRDSVYKDNGINIADAGDYSRRLRDVLTQTGGAALGDLDFPEYEDDDDTLNYDFENEFQSLMIDAEDAKAIPSNEPWDDADQDNPRVSMTGIPVDVLRKIKAMMARARHKNTPKPEAETAERKAKELMAKHRPDLANESYLRGLRSSSRVLRSRYTTAPQSNMEIRRSESLVRERVEERLKDVLALKQYKQMNPEQEASKQKYIELYTQSLSSENTEEEIARLQALMDEELNKLTASDLELDKRIKKERATNQSPDAMRYLYSNSPVVAQAALYRMIVAILQDDSKLKQNRQDKRNMIIEIASGGSVDEIAQKYGVSKVSVWKLGKKHKEVVESREKELSSQQFDEQLVSDFVADKIVLDRLANMTYPEIAKKYNLNTAQVQYVLRKLRDVKRPERQFAKRNREILKLHQEGATDAQLASKFKLDPSTIKIIIREEKKNRNREEKSAFSPLWVDLAVNSFEHEMFSDSYAIKGAYTKPTLRNRLKSEILRSSRGGAPGQWSARKAQLLANEYRKAGGGYRTNRPSRKQMALKKWNKKSYKKKLGDEIGRKYVRVTKTIKERQKEKAK